MAVLAWLRLLRGGAGARQRWGCDALAAAAAGTSTLGRGCARAGVRRGRAVTEHDGADARCRLLGSTGNWIGDLGHYRLGPARLLGLFFFPQTFSCVSFHLSSRDRHRTPLLVRSFARPEGSKTEGQSAAAAAAQAGQRQGLPIHLPQPQIQIHGEMGMVKKLPPKFRVPEGFLPLLGAMPVLRRGSGLGVGKQRRRKGTRRTQR
jgi:hypothetical protein